MMDRIFSKRSLAGRMIVTLVLGEIAFAVALALTIGIFTGLNATRQRAEALHEQASMLASSLMPIVADQREGFVQAQLASILESSKVNSICCIRIVDAWGATVASAGDAESVHSLTSESPGGLAALWDSQVVAQSIEVNGLTVATAYVRFEPLGLWEWLRWPLLSAGGVLLSMVLVTVPWIVWRVTGEVIAPLASLREYAGRIASGDTGVQPASATLLEIRELESALQTMAAQIQSRDARLQRSYSELTEAYAALEQTKRTIEQLALVKENFVAVAAHEIRAPLALISLHAELLQSGEVTELDDAGLRSAASISAAASRLSSIASDLTDAALLERGMMSLHITDVWLDELLEEAVADAGVMAHSRRMQVRIDGEVPEMLIRGDGLRLRQVLDNLLSNALKYSPVGSEVTVRALTQDECVLVEVADRGRGVAVERQDRLFTLFGRLDLGDARDTPGLGLGLAISARIIAAHGGEISYRPRSSGPGSVFSFWVPCAGPRSGDASSAAIAIGEG